MEGWRIIATALFGASGITLALFVMAKVREKTESGGQTAIAGSVVLAAAAIIGVLMATVLSAGIAWAIVIVAGVVVTVLVLAS